MTDLILGAGSDGRNKPHSDLGLAASHFGFHNGRLVDPDKGEIHTQLVGFAFIQCFRETGKHIGCQKLLESLAVALCISG